MCVQALAQEVAHYLGMDLSGIKIKRFADGEIYVQVQVAGNLVITYYAITPTHYLCDILLIYLEISVAAAAGIYSWMRCFPDTAHLPTSQRLTDGADGYD